MRRNHTTMVTDPTDELDRVPHDVRTYLTDRSHGDTAVIAALETVSGFLSSGMWIVILTDGIQVVDDGLLDTTGERIERSTIAALTFKQEAPDRTNLRIQLRSGSRAFDVFPPSDDRLERLRENLSGVYVEAGPDQEVSESRPGSLGDDIVSEAEAAYTDGNLSEARQLFESAITIYQQSTDGSGGSGSGVEECRERLREIDSLQYDRERVSEELSAAEHSYQTAIGAFAQGKTTLGRIRFRQARTQFEDALTRVDDADTDPFRMPLVVPFGAEAEIPSDLGALPTIDSNAETALEDHGISELESLVASDTGRRVDIHQHGSDERTAALLLVLTSWQDESVRYSDRERIERRRRLADVGFRTCR